MNSIIAYYVHFHFEAIHIFKPTIIAHRENVNKLLAQYDILQL